MKNSEIKNTIKNMKVGEELPITDCGTVIFHANGTYTVTDNGEQVTGLNMTQAIRIAQENNQ